MSLIRDQIPEAEVGSLPNGLRFDEPDDLMQRWMALRGDMSTEDDTIDIFDVIGADFFGDGVDDKQIAAALGKRSGQEIRVRINSPGGDVFAGLGIYNLFRNHNAKVVMEITGIAASAASIIAMAGDEIVMGDGSMMMIHNAWGMSIGNKSDHRQTADMLDKVDGQMVGIYVGRTGIEDAEIVAMMDNETFLTHTEAVEKKFADSVNAEIKCFVTAKASNDKNPLIEQRRIERGLGRIGVPRSQRQQIAALIMNGEATRDAGNSNAARDAGTREASDLMTRLAAEIGKL